MHGIVKATAESIGLQNLMRDFGVYIANKTPIYADASAALGMTQRSGVGRVKHLDTQILWVQEKRVRKVIEFAKVKGTENPADMMTKHVGRELIEKYLHELNVRTEERRPACAPGRPDWR